MPRFSLKGAFFTVTVGALVCFAWHHMASVILQAWRGAEDVDTKVFSMSFLFVVLVPVLAIRPYLEPKNRDLWTVLLFLGLFVLSFAAVALLVVAGKPTGNV